MAEGRVWTGYEAHELGLVDRFGGLSQAVKEAVALAELKGDFEIEEFPKVRTTTDAIAELLEVRERVYLSWTVLFSVTQFGENYLMPVPC